MTSSDTRQGNHDEFFAKCFEDLSIARSFLQHYLPPEIVDQVNLDQIALEHGSFVDEELRRSYSDLLYTIPFWNQDESDRPNRALIYILLEHKSESYEFTAFQLLRYMVRIWQRELERVNYRAGFRLPPIVPIIIHHGRARFRAPVDFGDLVVTFSPAASFVPRFRCLLIDLMAVGRKELPSSDARLHAVLSVMQSVFGEEINPTAYDMTLRLAAFADRPEFRHTLNIIFNYILQSASKLTNEGFLKAIAPLGKMGDQMMSTLIEKWKEQGLLEGREQGIEQGITRGMVKDRQNSIVEVLSARFKTVPETLAESVRSIGDLEELVRLTSVAATCESIDHFVGNMK